MSSPETQPSPEKKAEIPTLSEEQIERLSNPETAEILDVEKLEREANKAEKEAKEVALAKEDKAVAEKETHTAKAPRRKGAISRKEKSASFKKQMKHVQEELPPAQRAFSKIIHNPVIEKTSEVVGATVARPNAILTGSIVAFVAVLAVYLIARHYGYVLSGFETIAAFIIGWAIGFLYDYFKTMITGKR